MDSLPSDSEFLGALVADILAEIDPDWDITPTLPTPAEVDMTDSDPTSEPEQ